MPKIKFIKQFLNRFCPADALKLLCVMNNQTKKSSFEQFQTVELKKQEIKQVKGGYIIVEDYIEG